MPLRFLLALRALSVIVGLLPGLAAANAPANASTNPSVAPPAVAVPIVDNRVGSVARLLAGLAPANGALADIADTNEWREHRDIVQAGWAKVKQGRGGVMARWRDEVIGTGCSGSGNLLYPFSGPDFANAYVLFPGCRNYVLFGLELPGEVPEPDKLDRQALGRLLADVRVAVGDLVERNYFITSRMSRQLHTSQLKGVVPVIMASMALAGLEVRSVEPLELRSLRPDDEADQPGPKPLRKLRAVQITFQRPGATQAQTLQYFSVDATNR